MPNSINEYHLLIDDIRDEEMCGVTDIKFDVIARTAREGMLALREKPVTHLWLDNDLGIDQVEGCEILKMAILHDVVPDNVMLVTANPIAKRRMEETLANDLGYSCKINSSWWCKPIAI